MSQKSLRSADHKKLLYSWNTKCCSKCFTDITDKGVKSYHFLVLDSTKKKHFEKKPRRYVTKPRFTFTLMPSIAEFDFAVAFYMKLSTPATIIPEALKTVSLTVDILDF